MAAATTVVVRAEDKAEHRREGGRVLLTTHSANNPPCLNGRPVPAHAAELLRDGDRVMLVGQRFGCAAGTLPPRPSPPEHLAPSSIN